MSTRRATSVKCSCGWRGRRVEGECSCYDEYAMSCSCAWGRCPRCNGRVYPVELLRRWENSDRQVVSHGTHTFRKNVRHE